MPQLPDHIHTVSHPPELNALLDLCVGRLKRRAGTLPHINPEHLRHISDWLRAALANDEPWLKNVDAQGRQKKLLKFGSIDAIVREADKAMLKAAQKLRGVTLVDGDEELVETLQDGYYVVRLLTPAALDRESAEMQHCIGGGGYDARLNDGKHQYLSLRDPQGKAHVTMEIVGRELVQYQGKQNAPPVRRYADKLVPFIRSSGFLVSVRPSHLGYIVDSIGDWHPLDDLPEGLHVDGNLNLDGANIASLPKGTTIGGFLELYGSGITSLPEGLTIGRDIYLWGVDLTKLPRGLTVLGTLDLTGTKITELPDDLTVGCDLDLDGTGVRELPEGLKVGRYLDISRTGITVLPDSLDGSVVLFREHGRTTVAEFRDSQRLHHRELHKKLRPR